jgi:hypothetical protein
VGHSPHPHLLPPWEAIRGNGRFDLPTRQARVLYLAEQRLTAYLERGELQALRPNIRLCWELEQMQAAVGRDPHAPQVADEIFHNAGMIPPDWFARYEIVELSPAEDQKWLDLRNPYVIEQLRRSMAGWFIGNGFGDFQLRDLLHDIEIDNPDSVPVTQEISNRAFRSGFNGIVAPSRTHAAGVCWALYEGTVLEPDATVIPIAPSDRDLQATLRIYGLRLPIESQPGPTLGTPDLDVHRGRVVPTGRVVRGAETELVETKT